MLEGGLDVPDLLHATPVPWGDLLGAVELARFAFEGGDCEGVFDTVVDALPLAPSTLDPATFASQLYLDELVTHALRIVVGGSRIEPRLGLLRRVISAPPADAAHAETRKAVLRELVREPRLRSDLERTLLGLRTLKAALEMATGSEPNLVRRKIGVLVALRDVVLGMRDGFVGATSALALLPRRARAITDKPAWSSLVELIDAEGNLATVDVRLQLGSDGTIRGFGVLAIRERDSSILPGPVVRFWQRIASFLRGYRYGESEVVLRLLEEVFAPLAEDVVALLALTGSLEVYLASLGFRDLARSKGLEVSLAELVPARSPEARGRALRGLFNPLLFLQDVTPIACDVPLERPDALVVLTGPNSGGKTRLLQAVALTQLLGEAGLFVPAREARIVHAPKLFLSLVVDGDAGQIEGRLGTELVRIRQLFEQLEPGAMAILDELCSGTNPNEGESIFEMVVRLLPELAPQVFVSTHFLGLAQRLAASPPVEQLAFLQVELDAEERPTFQFVPGVATTSLAHRVAARLGVTEDALRALIAPKRAPSS